MKLPCKVFRLLSAAAAGLTFFCFALPLNALDPDRMLSQYLREHWGSERGFTGGGVTALAQTADGYLWIGTEKGLIRFDGTNFRFFPQATPTTFPIGPVQNLVADAQGNLWILLKSTKVLRYRDGRFELGREEAEFGITSEARRKDGSVVFSSMALGNITYNSGKFEVLTPPARRSNPGPGSPAEATDELSSRLSWATGVVTHRFAEPNSAVIAMAEGSEGEVWLGTRDKGLFVMRAGMIVSVAKGIKVEKINCLLPLENGELWIGTDEGVVRWNGTELTRAGVPQALKRATVLAMIRDRDLNIWLGTPKGLLRSNDGGVASLEVADAQANAAVNALFEDREGNLWIGTARGIARFRDSAFVTYSAARGLPGESNGPIYVDGDGKLWFAPVDGGLHWRKGDLAGSVTEGGLGKDVIYSIAGKKNDLWLGRQQRGLTHLRENNGVLAAQTFTEAQGLVQDSVYAVHLSADGTVWAGTLRGGVSELRNGHFTTYTAKDGLASDTIAAIAEGRDGAMWFATPNGLSVISNGAWRSFKSGDGLPSENLNCLLEDSKGILWIGGAAGIAFLRSGRVEVPSELPDSLRDPIFGMAEDRNGLLWISTSNHVLRVSRDQLLSGKVKDADVREYGQSDGLDGTEGVKRQESVIADARGRIWFSMNRGISFVDPVRATKNSAPALVHVDSLFADGVPIELKQPIRIPSGRQRIALNFAGLSLSVPERVRYRYQLQGFEGTWSEPGNARSANYTNLRPGLYHFRVMASNSDGVWNTEAANLDFNILPAFYQTVWFYVLCFLALGCIAWAGYRSRVRQMRALLDMQFEERLSERSRIAGELHDTLLQSFQGLTLHFQKARNLLPGRPAEAIQTLDRALDGAEQAIVEGRDAILGLRSPSTGGNDLAEQITELGKELVTGDGTGGSAKFRVLIEGAAHALHPLLEVEVFRVAREALRNAFGHSQAQRIEAEIAYSKRLFRLRIRDDGKGIDPQVLEQGERAGHMGLPGMRERARRIGGQLDVWSEPGAGTEVELSIPGSIAYSSSNSRGVHLPFRKKNKPTYEPQP